MSYQYKHGDRIPSEVLANQLDEFCMCIPAELDHDADLVLHAAAERIRELEAMAGSMVITSQNEDGTYTKWIAGELNCHELITDDMIA